MPHTYIHTYIHTRDKQVDNDILYKLIVPFIFYHCYEIYTMELQGTHMDRDLLLWYA